MDPVADTTTSNDVLFALTIKKERFRKTRKHHIRKEGKSQNGATVERVRCQSWIRRRYKE